MTVTELVLDGIASLDEFSDDNIMCETDYPHSDSTRLNCMTSVKKVIGHLPPETQYKLLRWNAERPYRFTPAEPPATSV
jgi:predicted TIM-barrel fold metal-dependent hydrolase